LKRKWLRLHRHTRTNMKLAHWQWEERPRRDSRGLHNMAVWKCTRCVIENARNSMGTWSRVSQRAGRILRAVGRHPARHQRTRRGSGCATSERPWLK
jgi:hypothetical protein